MNANANTDGIQSALVPSQLKRKKAFDFIYWTNAAAAFFVFRTSFFYIRNKNVRLLVFHFFQMNNLQYIKRARARTLAKNRISTDEMNANEHQTDRKSQRQQQQ